MPPILDKIVFVARLEKKSSDIDKERYVTHSGYLGTGQIPTAAVRMNIQPASAETQVLVEGVFGKTYTAFTSSSGVVEGMQLTVSGTGQQYFVRGREVHDNGILPDHYELVLTKDKR
jgi:hypothetical protein